jgi:hypothetical protein
MQPLLSGASPDVHAELARLREENAQLKAGRQPAAPAEQAPTDAPPQSKLQYLKANAGDLCVKATLLAIVLIIYAGVPEVVSYSRYVDTGLTGRVYAPGACGESDEPVMAAVDRTIDVTKWPALDDGFRMRWSGYITLPDVSGLVLELEVDGQPKANSEVLLDNAPLPDVLPVGKTPIVVDVRNLKKGAPDHDSYIKLVYYVQGVSEREVVPADWLNLDQDETPEYKGKPYLDATPVAMTKIWMVFPWGIALAFAYGGVNEIWTCFNPEVLWAMLPCGFLFSIADTSEILAQGGIDPTTYIVLSQARLLLTALLMKWSVGTGQTSLQWMDLVNLSFLIIVFQMLPNDFVTTKAKGATVQDQAMMGVIMTMAKVLLSVYAGVAQQRAMQGNSPGGRVSFIAQVTAQQVCGIPAILLALPLCSSVRGTPLTVFGFWGGPDGGWDYRTWAVVCAYTFKNYFVSLVIKRFDALIKNICNAGACLLTYFWATSVTHKLPGLYVGEGDESRLNQAAVVKIFIIFSVLVTVMTYSVGGSYVKKPPATKPAAKSDLEMSRPPSK